MSLFGSSPPSTPSRTSKAKSSLFDDDPPASRSTNSFFDDDDGASTPAAGKTSSSLFADTGGADESDPWAFPTPRKGGKGGLVKSLLAGVEVPEVYVDVYDALVAEEGSIGVGKEAVGKVFEESGVGREVRERIEGVVGVKEGGNLGRAEFNVLMALVGLAQEEEEPTLDGVDERRRNLPIPTLGSLTAPKQTQKPEPTPTAPGAQGPPSPPAQRTQPTSSPSPMNSKATRKTSFGFPEADPWNSPDMHRGHNHPSSNGLTTATNGTSRSAAAPQTQRTTSAFTTNSESQGSMSAPGAASVSDGSGWGSYNGASSEAFAPPGLNNAGFAARDDGAGGAGNNPSGLGRSLGPTRVSTTGPEEVVTVATLEEKEGMFLFQHRNYEVTSVRRNSKVVRRYSDFTWLLDCLQKRYPFRQLPLLPPKGVAINGNHLSADSSFLEKRRRGLVRFANALVRHPVLSQEQLVTMFLTVPTELAVWRKQATISVQEEFVGKSLPPNLEDSLPADLQDLFDTVRAGVRRSAEMYINMCTLLERLAKRNEGLAADSGRFSAALHALTEASNQTYATDTSDVPLLNTGLSAAAKHLSNSQALLIDEAHAWDEGVLEDLKRVRDAHVSMRDVFERRDRLDRDNIPQLERRIRQNEDKLVGIRNKPEELRKVGEAEKVEEAILKDKTSIINQHARSVFIKECIRDELITFQSSQYVVSRLHQDWAQERVKYAELQADNWRQLGEEVESMPLGD
ncbi:hypothetical protein K402DRAFT_325641 [Aulographum hederae CBS 113979]|uniref:Sorting nexin MVP1 n=1 Tax=Aulographum hederae CBS 113979 TaxID=1176131 RepID=A0A6G1H9L0_9PEZI|nr:hypothetical protein K402DRAFT_325641 [Aulographum hederae CBS 113979]